MADVAARRLLDDELSSYPDDLRDPLGRSPTSMQFNMIRKIEVSAAQLTRQHIADPHLNTALSKRQEQAGAVDLRLNKIVAIQANGYATVHPIDREKKLKAEA